MEHEHTEGSSVCVCVRVRACVHVCACIYNIYIIGIVCDLVIKLRAVFTTEAKDEKLNAE